MYSVVLLAALTTAPSSQAWLRSRCHGCHGCYATCGCVAPACTCSYSYSCSGCYGCHGCHGGCYGVYSGFNGYPSQCHGCYGCYAGWSCYGYPVRFAPAESAPPSIIRPLDNKTPGKIEQAPPPKDKKKTEEARARVIVDVPADAKLFVDRQLMSMTSARRIFQTPELNEGQTYFYDLTAEVIRDGQTVTASQRVILRPGQAATASFADLGQRRDATVPIGEQ